MSGIDSVFDSLRFGVPPKSPDQQELFSLSLDSASGPHRESRPKFLCEPNPLTPVYHQTIVGVYIADTYRSYHSLSRRGDKIPHSLAERIGKPDVAFRIDGDARDMRAGTLGWG